MTGLELVKKSLGIQGSRMRPLLRYMTIIAKPRE